MGKGPLFKNPKEMSKKEIIVTIDALSKRSAHAQHQILLLYKALNRIEYEEKKQKFADERTLKKRKEWG